jgi:Uma2 family endonuclease
MSAEGRARQAESGPFRADQLKPGDRYELSKGHAIFCASTGGDGARGNVAGAQVLDSDPGVESSGIDAGFTPDGATLRAPDISVGGVPDQRGWIAGAPPLAVEYASVGQDEEKLQEKIVDLLGAGTRFIWVVRLVGARRVEVYEPGQPPRTVGPGERLSAPGILRNEVPVEALYDRSVAHDVTLRNLLQRRGYPSVDSIREEGREEGREAGLLTASRAALYAVVAARGLTLSEADAQRIAACRDATLLVAWTRRAATASVSTTIFEE